jgi:hypothetical protein
MNSKALLALGIVVALASVSVAAIGAAKRPALQDEKSAPEETSSAPTTVSNVRISIYPIRTDGFSLNNSEVTELHRIAMQACYDAGLKCSGRGETVSNVQKEQSYEGRGHIAQARYVAEFTVVGKTQDKVKLGIPGGFNVGGGYGVNLGGAVVGGGLYTDLSGLGIRMDGMELTGQISDTSDGSLVYSSTKSKLSLRGSFIVGEAGGSNAKKLQKTFRDMFEEFRKRVGG